jgi:heme-degrading monooxygenase HmoA
MSPTKLAANMMHIAAAINGMVFFKAIPVSGALNVMLPSVLFIILQKSGFHKKIIARREFLFGDFLSYFGFVKHNTVRVKEGKREESTHMLLDFFDGLEGKVAGMRGYLILDNAKDPQESLVLTFWETKQDMEGFYQPNNKALNDFVEKGKSIMAQPPQRADYAIAKYKM